MDFYEQAVHYVEDLRWSVIPIQNNGSKRPALGNGEVIPYRSRYANRGELQKWFQNGNNYLGVITGKLSNLSVIDVDSPDAPPIESPLRAKTAHGMHYYFKYHPEVINYVKTLPGFDVRTEGGYVVVPPTPNYQWSSSPPIPLDLPMFPADLLHRLKAAHRKANKVNAPGWFGDAIKNLTPGNRNATFTRLVGSLHRDHFLPSDIFALLAPIADSVEFGHRELHLVIDSITRYDNTRDGVSVESIADFMKEIEPVEWLVPKMVAKGAFQFIAGLPETCKTWIMFDLAIEAARGGGLWLGKFPVGSARVYILDQERFKGETQRRLKAIMGGKQLTTAGLADRLFVRCGSTVKLNLDDSFRAFMSELQVMRPDLLIIDSFSKIHTLNENSDQDISKVIERINKIRRELKCTIIFISHETKEVFHDAANDEAPSAFRMTGSVQKSAAAEIVMTVRKSDGLTYTLYVTKNTLASSLPGVPITVTDVENGVLVAANG